MKRYLPLAAAALLTALPAAAELETYTVDPRHTFPSYEVSHFGYSMQRGRFNKASGTLFTSGEELRMRVAEISVPQIRKAATVDGLASAAVVQPLEEATDGRYSKITTAEYSRFGGLLDFSQART